MEIQIVWLGSREQEQRPSPEILHLCNLQYWQLSNTSGRIASHPMARPFSSTNPWYSLHRWQLSSVLVSLFLSKAILHFLWLGLLINSTKLCIFSSFPGSISPPGYSTATSAAVSLLFLLLLFALCADFNTFRNFRVGHEIGRGTGSGSGSGWGSARYQRPETRDQATNRIRVEFWQPPRLRFLLEF